MGKDRKKKSKHVKSVIAVLPFQVFTWNTTQNHNPLHGKTRPKSSGPPMGHPTTAAGTTASEWVTYEELLDSCNSFYNFSFWPKHITGHYHSFLSAAVRLCQELHRHEVNFTDMRSFHMHSIPLDPLLCKDSRRWLAHCSGPGALPGRDHARVLRGPPPAPLSTRHT